MPVDGVFLEIFKNRIQAISEEMANVVLRTGFTVFVKETADFGTFLLTPEGETFGSPVVTGVNLSLGIHGEDVIRAIPEWHEGDVVITNDPYVTGGMVTHLPDLFLLRPIFYEGTLLGFGCCFIHSSDVGGKVPGSVTPTAYDIFQEGVRIAPVKLYERGVLNEQARRFLLDNSRIPEQNWGDLRALMAAMNVAERRLHELCRRYGVRLVQEGIEALMAYAERQVRALIREIPDGEYVFWDYMESEGDPALGPQPPTRIRIRMVVQGDEIFLDFTGTDHQVRAAFNLPSANKKGHYMFVPTIVRYLRTLDRGIPFNAGMIRSLSNHAPRGSLVNPDPPAAVGVRAATFIRIMDILMATLGQAQPDRLPAAGAGQASIVLLAVPDFRTGRYRVAVVQPILGGSGGRPMRDGIDGMDFSVGYLRNVPAEVLETDMPVVIERYGLRPDSGGAGKHRGGCGIELAIQVQGPDTVLTARGMERMRFQPWGRLGGQPGAVGKAVLNPRMPGERPTGRIDELLLQPGEIITFLSQGGGGYGSPLDRDPERVLWDVRRGLVSVEAAAAEYGVVVRGPLAHSTVDEEATRKLRVEMCGQPRFAQPFAFGPERERFEAVWTDELQCALVETLNGYPPALRNYLKRQVAAAIESMARHGEAPTAADVARAAAEVAGRAGLAVLSAGEAAVGTTADDA